VTDDGLWQYQDVADHLGVKVSTVMRWAKERVLPVVKIGGRIRFRPEDIKTWVGDRKEVK
jgi:excisionase family DNA binding protein